MAQHKSKPGRKPSVVFDGVPVDDEVVAHDVNIATRRAILTDAFLLTLVRSIDDAAFDLVEGKVVFKFDSDFNLPRLGLSKLEVTRVTRFARNLVEQSVKIRQRLRRAQRERHQTLQKKRRAR